jgi:signal transduction histidine kinase/predicted RNA-binding protein with RPS1 domain
LPLGLSVELENGEHGIVRVREISWDQEKRLNWKGLYPVGVEAWAVPISVKAGHTRELSIRLAENDPWVDISGRFSKNEAYVGVVTGVTGYGAFIELASGVTGLLHESKLPSWVQKPTLELFWPGDRVRVAVEQIDPGKRRLGLKLPDEKMLAVSAPRPSPDSPEARRQAGIDALVKGRSNQKRILVVEDNVDQGKLVESWLEHTGQTVEVVHHGEEALASLETFSPDIVLIDLGLPGMDGIAVANQLLEVRPHLELVITTEFATADQRSKELDSLQERGVDFLTKPLLPEDLLDFLKKNSSRLQKTPATKERASEDSLFVPETSPTRSLRMLLQKSRFRLGFDAAILFRLDPVRRTVSIVESSTQSALNNYAVPSLVYSPVREIAEDEETVLQETCLQEDEARFQYLLELFPMQACIGVPVTANQPQKYALLFLDSEAQDIYEEDRLYAEAVSLAVGTYLEQTLLHEKSTLIQRYALIGQLTAALVHEVNNLMGPLNNRLELFKEKLESFKNKEVDHEKTDFLKNELGSVQQAIRKIIGTMRMLGRVIVKDKNEILRLDEIVTETIGLMRDIADREHVALSFTPPEKLLLIRSQSAALQQILLNLVLNAIQQTSEFRAGQKGGAVHISIELVSVSTPNSAIRMLVNDNGPGIHTSLWETIFELGYSTRQDGSGIGLFISKSLAEEKLNGRLFVQESYILGGTTIALEIPHRL